MQTGTHRPYEDSNKVALLGAHPIDKLTSKEIGNGIEQREHTGNRTIVAIGPVEVRSNAVLPC